MSVKKWHCDVCGKTTTSDTPNDDAAPEHISHRGQDIGNCPGTMMRVDDDSDLDEIRENKA